MTKVKIIQKISKGTDTNYYSLRNYFANKLTYVVDNLVFMGPHDIVELYRFFSQISIISPAFIEKFEADLAPKIISHRTSISSMKRHAKVLLDIWTSQNRYSAELY